MRVPKGWVPIIAKEIVEELLKRNMIELQGSKEKAVESLQEIMLAELTVEDRLNEEIRGMLKKFEPEIEKGRMDYRKLFDLTKQKLVKERNLVL
ncbi:MAG: DUF507 family protein [Nitrospiraceae bacterium]|nr:MAG: DUF507 family protein [Nitrospiraceae bacterium]